MIKISTLIFHLYFLYGVGSVLLSNVFYKFNFFQITPSELIILTSVILLCYNKNFPLLRFQPLLIIFLFFTFWFVGSFYFERETYFIIRQGASAFYLVSVLIGAAVVTKSSFEFKSLHFSLLSVSIIGGCILKFGHMDTAIPLLMLMLIFKKKFNFSVWLAVLLTFIFTGHASHKLALIIFFVIKYFDNFKKYLIFIVPIGICIFTFFVFYLYELGELTDANATWRYIYWGDLINFMIQNGSWLFGIGYGVPYINPYFPNFELLYTQIESGKAEFQIYTVPPHNSLLVIWYHIGIVPLLSLGYLWVTSLTSTVRKRDHRFTGATCGFLFILLTHNALELPYMALFCNFALGASFYNKMEK